jgi:hypothetical protein
MAKTTAGLTFRSVEVEFDVTAAMTAAISGLTTVEWITIDSIFSGPMDQGQQVTLPIAETNVSGDADPIISIGPNSGRVYNFTVLYTEGDTLGTDNIDFYSDYLKPLIEASPALPCHFRWSPNGGAVGDLQYTSETGNSWLSALSDPVGVVDENLMRVNFSVTTGGLTTATL